jgi:hypothetical protein
VLGAATEAEEKTAMGKMTRRLLAGSLLAIVGIAAGCGGNVNNLPQSITTTIVASGSAASGSPAVDQGQAVTLSATLVNDISSAGLSWSLAGPGTLSGNAATSVTYNAPATVAAKTTVVVTATPVARPADAVSYSIVINPSPVVTSSGALTAATVGTAYTATLAAGGGAGTLSWALASGSVLPAGLTLSKAGVISGTVTAPTTASFAVTVTDSSTVKPQTATSGTLTLSVAPVALAITPAALANAIQGSAYTASAFTTTGGTGAITWTASGLPAGLTIGASTGIIGGTPTAAGAAANIVVTATDSGTGAFQQTKSTAALSMTVYPTLTVGALSAITAVQSVTAVNVTATSSGGAGAITWTAAGLPAGVTIGASSGVISGTPTAAGSFSATITAKDAGTPQQSVATTLAMTVIARLAITTPALANAVQGTAFTSAAFTAAGGTGAISWTATGLPAGLTMGAGTGIISGTPTGSGVSTTVVVTATDSGSGALQQTQTTAALSLTVIPTLALTTTTLPGATFGTPYTATLAATGGVAPYAWSSAALPAGLGLNASTGVIAGTPAATNSGAISFTVSDAGTPQQTQSANLTLTVSAGTPVVTTAALAAATVNVPYSQTLTYNAEGQTGAAVWAISAGALPAGITLNPSTGTISGTATATSTSAVTVTVTVGVATSAGQPLSLGVFSALTVTSSATLPAATVGTAYSVQLQAAGGSGGGFAWSLTSGTLPAGLAALPGSGLISFTPTTAGTSNFTVKVTDSSNNTATQTVTLVVNPAPPVITTTTLPDANAGVAYNQQLAFNYGGTANTTTWTITGGGSSLTAAGLTMSASGLITGTPSSTGSASFTVTVTVNSQVSAPVTLAIAVTAAPAVTTSALQPAYVGAAYSATLAASGGSGYTWSVTAGQTTLTTLGLTLSSNGVLAGTPTVTGSGNVTFQVKNSSGLTGSATLMVAAYNRLALPAANPASLPAATTNANYNGTIVATGGAPGDSWTVNGTALATDGSQVALTGGLGLSVANTGNATLSVLGTPTTTGTVTFTAAVKDSGGTTAGPVTYSVVVSTTYSISGSVNLNNACGGGSSAVAGATITINTSPARTVTTDSNGNFTISGLANGAYTLTPSITGPSAAFYPKTEAVTINGASSTNDNFAASLGYTVSGTVAYSGSKTGRVYVVLSNNGCSGNINSTGTSIAAPGAFTIQGVAPGTYTVQSSMDTLGTGASNAADPSGATANFAVSFANATGANVTLADPAAVTLTAAPKLKGVSGFNRGALAQFGAITDNNGNELATSYILEWSTTSGFTAVAGSHTFPAAGTGGTKILLLNGLTDGNAYYFRLRGTAGSSNSPNSSVVGPVTIGAPTGGNTITGTVTFPATATGPLYTGFYDSNSGAFYGEYIATPVSPQAYSIQVPNGSSYFHVAVLDQDNNGVISAGDSTNIPRGGNPPIVPISGAATLNLSLTGANSTAAVTTSNFQSTTSGGTSQSYLLNFRVEPGTKLPVAVELTSGPNVMAPLDLAICGTCGTPFQFQTNINTTLPTTSDTYALKVTYIDGNSETLNATVSGIVSALPTNLLPGVSTSTTTTPTFTWTDPSNASNYTYQFQLFDANGNTIWQIPGNNSNSNGFDSSITSITWGTDPTGGGSTASVGSLTSGSTYQWEIQVQDSNGNTATQAVTFKP